MFVNDVDKCNTCYDAGCGMCAVPVDGLHKEDMTHEQLLKIQALLKRRIPTGKHDRSFTTFATY